MSDFEFLFALFGLMLGLSIAELLSGLARAIEERHQRGPSFRFGWLSPLLGTFVLLDLLSFWGAAWTLRNDVVVSGGTLMFVTFFASAYYMAARLVFPRAIEVFDDLDAHFWRVRRIVLGILLALLAVQFGYYAAIGRLLPVLSVPASLTMIIVLVLLLVLAITLKSQRWMVVVMALLVLRYVAGYILF